jgi:hypothetical protein
MDVSVRGIPHPIAGVATACTLETPTCATGLSTTETANIYTMVQRFSILIGMASIVLCAACSTVERRPPPSLEQIAQMSRDGKTAEEIIHELKETRAVYRLSGSQLAKLHEEGVPEPVLDYLQQAYVDSVRWQERLYYQDRLWMGGCIGCYYYRPWPAPFYFPY